jgi:hypothetical protein
MTDQAGHDRRDRDLAAPSALMFMTQRQAPPKRVRFAAGGIEQCLTEAAVMLAFALWLLEQPDAKPEVRVHPDGEHAKVFDIVAFMERAGFHRAGSLGGTLYGGVYARNGQTIIVNPKSGQGDVIGQIGARVVIAECKGGTINTTHPGQKSRLRKGLSELIGQLMILELSGARQVAVLPETTETRRLAERLSRRCADAGIEIALVNTDGNVRFAA